MVDHHSHGNRSSSHSHSNNHSHSHSHNLSRKNHWLTPNRRILFENIGALALALLVVFGIRSSVIEPFRIPSGSMIPTLMIGDHIFVDKMAYGIKVPFSDLIKNEPTYINKSELPKRGDIVVFVYPKDEKVYYIKRVIGLPGDVVEIRNKVLYINSKMINRDPVPTAVSEDLFYKLDDPKYSAQNLDVYSEHLDIGNHLIMLDKTNFSGESTGPVTIPPESIFVMGDNRDFSNDSRFWGFVPMKNVKGKAIFIWLSLSFDPFSFKPGRIGTSLH